MTLALATALIIPIGSAQAHAASAGSSGTNSRTASTTIDTSLPSRIRAFIDAHVPRSESAQEPDAVRSAPLPRTSDQTAKTSANTTNPMSSAATAPASADLVPNPSFEAVASNGIPTGWMKGGYGDNDRSLYLIKGSHSGAYAARVYITRYVSGDAKWYFAPVSVSGGSTYVFSDWYFANVRSEVDAQITHGDGSVSYMVLGKPAATAYGAYTQFSSTFTLPQDATRVSIFHVITSAGTLTVDDYSLAAQDTQQSGNYVPNGSLDSSGGNGSPAQWSQGGYGNNTRTFTYPISGESGSAAKVSLSNYQSGDAKWVSEFATLPPGTYQYADRFEADIPSTITAQFQRQDGTFFYSDLKTVGSANSWTSASALFTMPTDAVAVRVFHLIKQNGSLSIDSVSVTDASNTEQGIFKTGAVTFRFDDGDENQYATAAPILQNAGFTGTFYIISQENADNGFPAYMSIAQVKDLHARGFEIGAHTRTHPHLTTLSATEQQDEIAGSRQDLLGWNVGPVSTFAYPFGEYDATTIQIVKDAGFGSAAATIGGYVTPNSDHYQLEYQELHNDTTLAQVQSWIDTAAQTHSWLILTFHNIRDDQNDLYSTSPSMLQNIVNYVAQKKLPVVSVSKGMQSM